MNRSPCSLIQRLPEFLFLLAGLLSLPINGGSLHAQMANITIEPDAAGRSYLIAFPDTTTNITDKRHPNPLPDTVAVFIYSAVDNDVVITGREYSRTVHVQGGKMAKVYLRQPSFRAPYPIVTERNAVSRNTFRLEARNPVVIYCWMTTGYGGEAWTPIPIERWGREYIAACLPGENVIDMVQDNLLRFSKRRKMGPAEILVIAAYDGTVVNFYPVGQLIGGVPSAVTLNAGEAYQIQSYVDTSAAALGAPKSDIGGTRIVASRPVGVISGNTRAMVVDESATYTTNNSFKNMLIEWLPPLEQMGMEFVFMPSWDELRVTSQPGELLAQKRQWENIRVYGASSGITRIFYHRDSSRIDTFMVAQGGVKSIRIDVPRAHLLRTDKPAQVMMNSSAVVKFNGTSSNGRETGGDYDGWGAYMIELVPREQWVRHAAFHVPSQPTTFRHFVNIVADTGALDKIFDEANLPIDFNLLNIPGTDLMWASYQVTAGDHTLSSIDNTRFSAVVYGHRLGGETYLPRAVKKEENPWLLSSESLASSEYIEVLGLSYGYPAGPRRNILRPGDSLRIDRIPSPCDMVVQVSAINPEPVGLRSITLDSGSINLDLTLISPAPDQILGATSAEFRLAPRNPRAAASGIVTVADRTGKRREVAYTYLPDSIGLNIGPALDFGEVTAGGSTDSTITLRNLLGRPVRIESLRMVSGNMGFSVTGTSPALPATIGAGDSILVMLRATPASGATLVSDTLLVRLACYDVKVLLRAGAAIPCIDVDDLDFGELGMGSRRTLGLQICNLGRGRITFANPAADTVITWISENFSISPAGFDSLKNSSLDGGECITIGVTFTATVEGTFQTSARVWGSTRECNDTSYWVAIVNGDIGGVEGEWDGYALIDVQPNPANDRAAITFQLGRVGPATVAIYNAIGEKVTQLADRWMESGRHTLLWDASGAPAGIYYCRIESGGWSSVRRVIVMK